MNDIRNSNELKDYILEKGKEIYKIVEEYVNDNKDDDDLYFNYACIKMKDGRLFEYSFATKTIRWIDNPTMKQLSEADYNRFLIMDVSDDYSYIVINSFLNEKGERIDFIANNNIRYTFSRDKEEIKSIKRDFDRIYEQFKNFEFKYDKEATHSPSNYIEELKKMERVLHFYERKNELKEKDPSISILPSVEIAVDYLTNLIDKKKVDDNQITIFKETVARGLMDLLAQGVLPRLSLYDEYYKEFLDKSNINYRSILDDNKDFEIVIGVDYVLTKKSKYDEYEAIEPEYENSKNNNYII